MKNHAFVEEETKELCREVCITNDLTPVECIEEMFGHTDENGVVYIPEWPYDDDYDYDGTRYYECHMNWNEEGKEKVIKDFIYLYEGIRVIGLLLEKLPEGADIDRKTLGDKLYPIWCKYLNRIEPEGFDSKRIDDIREKKEAIYYKELPADALSPEEEEYLDLYRDAVRAEAEKKIGKGLASYDVLIRARRVSKLFGLHAPEIIVKNEARLLAQAMAVHSYCYDKKTITEEEIGMRGIPD